VTLERADFTDESHVRLGKGQFGLAPATLPPSVVAPTNAKGFPLPDPNIFKAP